jgi:hypothetical protein
MSDPADFLNRWSRRKRAAAEGRVDVDETKTSENEAREARPAPAKLDVPPETADAESTFDIGKLPSLDSIGPDTDVSAFLQPGVPTALRHAALRRAWVTDPAIRDFRAPQELDWDFNAPGVPGFGEIGTDVDVTKMTARILGELSSDEPPKEAEQIAPVVESGRIAMNHPAADDSADNAPDTDQELVHREENAASQQDEPAQPAQVRRHGGAMPE